MKFFKKYEKVLKSKPYLLYAIAYSLLITLVATSGYHLLQSDSYVRKNAVRLSNIDGGSCSGIRVKSPYDGKTYILSAAHCLQLAYELPDQMPQSPMQIMSTTPVMIIKVDNQYGGGTEFCRVIKTDISVDLMLLETGSSTGIAVSNTPLKVEDKVYTMTRGAAMAVYRTDGVVTDTNFMVFDPFFFVKTVTTARILPGSSGGALLNQDNELVGIVTHGDGTDFFSYFATLSQIRKFLQ